MFKMLDVGCGAFPRGDVNCDLFVKKSPHTKFDIKHGKNFVRCDAHKLPFKDNTFTIVYASHILEHLPNPDVFLKQAKRVSTKYLYIQVPSLNYIANNIKWTEENPEHLYTWSKDSLRNLLKRHFPNVRIYETHFSRVGAPIIRGKILKKLGTIGKIIGLTLKQFYCTELTAICSQFTPKNRWTK